MRADKHIKDVTIEGLDVEYRIDRNISWVPYLMIDIYKLHGLWKRTVRLT